MKETSWKYVAARPSQTLEAFGCAFGGFSEYSGASVQRLEPPAAAAVIVLCCGEPVSLQPALSRGSPARSSAFAAGFQVPAQCVTHSGVNDCVEIRLPPLAAYILLGGAMTEASRDPISLLDLAPHPITILLDELRATSEWQRRLAAVDRFLARGLALSKRFVPPELSWAWEALERSHGQVTISALTRSIGWSERHFITRFRAYFGVGPKTAARRLRFTRAFNLISMHPTADLCMIASQSGFSDQSHMTREFRSLSGATPGTLRTARFDDLPGIPASVLING